MSVETKARIVDGYVKDKNWSKIWEMFHALKEADKKNKVEEPTGLFFTLYEGLIYHSFEGYLRLCLPRTFELEIFRLIHDQNAHAGRHRIYQRIAEFLYFHNLARRVKLYVDHCHECRVNQTTRHKFYGALIPISPPAVPYHTVAMNFIL